MPMTHSGPPSPLLPVSFSSSRYPPPRLRHGICDARIRLAAHHGALGGRRHAVYPVRLFRWSALHFLVHISGRGKLWKTLEPEARRLRLRLAKLPGLDYLVRPAVDAAHDPYRILDGDMRHMVERRESEEEAYAHLLPPVAPLLLEPSGARDREMGAWRECHHGIPGKLCHLQRVCLDVPLGVPPACRQQVA